MRTSHCQLSNCSGSTIDSSSVGTASAVLIRARWRRARVSGSTSLAPPSRGSGSLGGAGRTAPYPVFSTVAMAAETSVPSGRRTVAFSVA